MDYNLLATFFLLVGLELVLGIDNILLISIVTDRVAPEHRNKVRYLGLGLALAARLLLLLGAGYLVKLSEPVLGSLSYKSIVLLAGGAFLIYKSVKEIHHVVESKPEGEDGKTGHLSFSSAVTQILMLDIVFSIDSVITAVGLTDNLWVIYSSVIVSFVLVLAFAGAIASFVQRHATLKILALSFLITIGVTLGIEGLGGHVPKAYIYLPMGFALGVELLQMRFMHNQKKK
ncbi:MAG: rane protein [Pseudobdellovibrio sp.]|jgi:predicted tellurium resistance membrane protein TerC|nr:rane protein [Pseudobdellovibrio sp.]